MRALVVSPQPFFTPRGTPLSVYYRTLITAELGHEVDLLTYGEGRDADIPGVRIHRIPRFRFMEPVPVGPSWRKVWLDGFIILWTIGRLLRRRYDFVHGHEEAIFFLRYLKPIFRFKLVYDMHSSLPQQLTNFAFTKSKLLIRVFEFLERASVRGADAVITISQGLLTYAQGLVQEGQPLILIENSICDDVRLRGSDEGGRSTEALATLPSGRPIIAYAGTFESYQGIDLVLKAHAKVVSERPDAFLLLMGGSPRQVEEQRALARELCIEGHCLFTGTIPQHVARAQLRQANIVVSPRTVGGNVPSKVYELMSMGVPLVATRVTSHTQVLTDEICVLADPNPVGIAEGILSLLREPARGAELVARARALYQAVYSRDVYVRKMEQLMAHLG